MAIRTSSCYKHRMMSSSQPKKEGVAARLAMLHCLIDVLEHHRSLDRVFAHMRHDSPELSAQDYAFIEHCVRATIKHMPRLIPYLSQFLNKPWNQFPLHARYILALATMQIHRMHIPAYAAVDGAVECAKHAGLGRVSGVINVVLKKVMEQPLNEADTTWHQHVPAWLLKQLKKDYGRDKALAILSASFADVTVWDRTLRDPYATLEPYAYAITPASWRSHLTGEIRSQEGYEEGEWWVQDAAAALPLYALQHLIRDKQILDACAAPGGKTMQLAAYGGKVTAWDRSHDRLRLLHENLARTQLHADVACVDILQDEPFELYDMIVLDAPCSATGTLRRNPDILYHLNGASAITELSVLQERMMYRTLEWLKEGGILLFCTCSLFKSEGEDHVAKLLKLHGDRYRLVPFDTIPSSFLNAQGAYRSLPFMHRDEGGMDGFFAALIEKKYSA